MILLERLLYTKIMTTYNSYYMPIPVQRAITSVHVRLHAVCGSTSAVAPGGWAATVDLERMAGTEYRSALGHLITTTRDRAALMAAIGGFETIVGTLEWLLAGVPITVQCSSFYVYKGCTRCSAAHRQDEDLWSRLKGLLNRLKDRHIVNWKLTLPVASDMTRVVTYAHQGAIAAERHVDVESTRAVRTDIYSDGSYINQRQKGGWAGIILLDDVVVREIVGTQDGDNVSSLRMELAGAVNALEALSGSRVVTIYTDCLSVLGPMSIGMPDRWAKRGWTTVRNQSIQHVDLWKRLDAACKQHKVEWKWVKAHSGIRYNERADYLAKVASGARC